jgi:hypothetical protein
MRRSYCTRALNPRAFQLRTTPPRDIREPDPLPGVLRVRPQHRSTCPSIPSTRASAVCLWLVLPTLAERPVPYESSEFKRARVCDTIVAIFFSSIRCGPPPGRYTDREPWSSSMVSFHSEMSSRRVSVSLAH